MNLCFSLRTLNIVFCRQHTLNNFPIRRKQKIHHWRKFLEFLFQHLGTSKTTTKTTAAKKQQRQQLETEE